MLSWRLAISALTAALEEAAEVWEIRGDASESLADLLPEKVELGPNLDTCERIAQASPENTGIKHFWMIL